MMTVDFYDAYVEKVMNDNSQDNFIIPKQKIMKDHLDDFEVDNYEYNRKYID